MALRKTAPAFLRRADADKAFERLYERHVHDVYRYAAGMLGATADAEDVTQTTFLNAYRAFKQGTRPEKPKPWLITIAHNVCRQRFRQAQRRPHEVEFDERFGKGSDDDISAPSAEDLRRALSQLAPNQRAAIVMRELEGCSYAEIAEVLGINVSALETVLFRARRALREQLEERLTCREAGIALNKQLDGRASRAERRALRAHLRACAECNSLAQSQRAQRRALKTLVLVPLPATISHWMGGQSAAAATGVTGAGGLTAAAGVTAGGGAAGASSVVVGGVAAKVAAVVVAGAVVGGGTYGVARAEHPVSRIAQPPAAPALLAGGERTSQAPRRVAPVAFIVTSRPAIAHKPNVANKSHSAAHGSRATRPGQTASAIAHTPRSLRSTPPGQAVKALRSAAPASAKTNKSTKRRAQPNAHASGQRAHPVHSERAKPVHPVHPVHPPSSRTKPKDEQPAPVEVSRGIGKKSGEPKP
ncbi:MAG TPA: sigma-70 family RNA polymerase sigma factor [Gaiellaceae bacterium]